MVSTGCDYNHFVVTVKYLMTSNDKFADIRKGNVQLSVDLQDFCLYNWLASHSQTAFFFCVRVGYFVMQCVLCLVHVTMFFFSHREFCHFCVHLQLVPSLMCGVESHFYWLRYSQHVLPFHCSTLMGWRTSSLVHCPEPQL